MGKKYPVKEKDCRHPTNRTFRAVIFGSKGTRVLVRCQDCGKEVTRPITPAEHARAQRHGFGL